MRQDSRSVTPGAIPIHQQAHCQAYCWGCLSQSSYLPDLWLVKWMTPAWFPMSDDMRGLTRGFQTDPLLGSPRLETNFTRMCLCVNVQVHMHLVYMNHCLCGYFQVSYLRNWLLGSILVHASLFTVCIHIFWLIRWTCRHPSLYSEAW